jgi:2,4-dienoyl-CoA reductase-like NADH-dependent reductase (Old Yellow Enzyme family)
MFEALFQPIHIGTLEIKNRMIVPAMVTNTVHPTQDGRLTERYIAYHEAKAKGGWGLIITEDYPVSPNAGGFLYLPGLWDDEHIQGNLELTGRVHAAGCRIFTQIYHAGRQTTSAVCGIQPVAPSAIADPTMPEIPKELTVKEIEEIVDQFVQTALRAKKAGFDGIEIHGGHGYLIAEFLSAYTNKRTDEYGGSIHGRTKFALDIIKAIRKALGRDFPICFRLSAEEFVEGGQTIEEAKALARLLEKAGVDAINCSQACYTTVQYIAPSSAVPKAFSVANAQEIKKVVNIPVIGVGRINDPYVAEQIIISGRADIVAMGRASIADPDFPNKIKSGNIDEIQFCIGCNQGCIRGNERNEPVSCLVNPKTGREHEMEILPAAEKKKILIAGGGIAGCEAAIVAAQRGHDVHLYEKGEMLGGQWISACVPPAKRDFSTFVIWQKYQLKKYNVSVYLNTELTKSIVEAQKPDVVMVAAGSCPSAPPIKGLDMDKVEFRKQEKGSYTGLACEQKIAVKKNVFANDVLLGKTNVGKNVVVIGGGLVGAETAEYLTAYNKNITILEMLDEIVPDSEYSPKYFLMENLKNGNVAIHTKACVEEILDDRVVFMHEGVKKEVLADTVIVATGTKPCNELIQAIHGIVPEIICIGDANSVKNGYNNILEGYKAGLSI